MSTALTPFALIVVALGGLVVVGGLFALIWWVLGLGKKDE